MGICMVALTLNDDKIEKIMADPPLVWRIVSPEDTEFYLQEIGQSKPAGFLSKLFGGNRQWPPAIPSFAFAENESNEIDMDKSWDGVNFCIKKLIHPSQCRNLFEDGRPIGKVEIGYGPAMCFTSEEVSKIAKAYGAISEENLLAQFSPAEMKGVYLDGLWQRGGDDAREYLSENFAALKIFLNLAEKNRLGIVIQYT